MLAVLLGIIGSLAAATPTPAGSAKPEIRFCPATLWTYPVESQRGLHSAVLQAIAIVNPATGAEFKAQSAELQLLNKGEVKESRMLSEADLTKMAAAAPQIEGLHQILPGQFCDGAVFGGGKIAKAPAVAPGEALVLMPEVFVWTGERDAVRVVVRGSGKSGQTEVRGELPIRAGVSKTAFRFPLSGDWFIGAGPTLHSHHRWATMEEFAYDILKLGDKGLTHSGDGSKFTDYFAYGAPVLAAADGEIVQAVNDVPEDASAMRRPDESQADYRKRLMEEQGQRLAGGERGLAGNFVIVAHANGEFSGYSHLKPGSVRVKIGQKVKAGEPLAELGSSGNSTEPHLHFQISDGPKVLSSAAIPPQFVDVELPWELASRPLQTGDFVRAK